VGEILGELLAGVVSAVVGFAVGSIVYVLVRLGRRAFAGLDGRTEAVDRRGERWEVRVALAPTPLRFHVSRAMFSMHREDRRRRELADGPSSGVGRDELMHPVGLVGKLEELSGLVVWFLLAFVLVAFVVLLVEAVLVALLAAIVFVVRTAWGRWECEVTAPDGRTARVRAGSLRDAREHRALLVNRIESSLIPSLPDG
jgi:Flp pilus assembly protein TadB